MVIEQCNCSDLVFFNLFYRCESHWLTFCLCYKLYKVTYFGNAVNYGSEQFFMCHLIVTECFHNKCFKLSTLCSAYLLGIMSQMLYVSHDIGAQYGTHKFFPEENCWY